MSLMKPTHHRSNPELALAYKSYVHPLTTESVFVPGSQNLLTSPKGYAERRPGFSLNLESTGPTTFNNLQRLFSWETFSGSFIQMACDIDVNGFAHVYKMQVGVDTQFQSLYTDTTANVFDFVVSNSTCYFSNSVVAKKWNPSIGLQNWGISIGATASFTGPSLVGSGSDVAYSGGTAWTNPGNITASDATYATVSLTQGGTQTVGPNGFGSQSAGADWAGVGSGTATNLNPGGTNTSSALLSTNFGFNIPSSATINGIQVSITRKDNPTSQAQDASVILLKNGSPTGNDKLSGTLWPGTFTAATYGSSSDLWGASWTASDINNSNFGLQLKAEQFNASLQVSVSTITITVTYTPAAGTQYSDYLEGTNAGFSLGATSTIQGIEIDVKGFQSTANVNTQLQVTMLKAGNLIGVSKSTNLGGSNATVALGGSSDLWGTSWTATDVNNSAFGVALQAISNTAGTVSWSIDSVSIKVWWSGGPNVTFTGTGLTATTGYQYVYCYANSQTGHVSSPSPASNIVKPSNQGMSIPLVASTDAQVNQIRLYRSTDSVTVGSTGNAGSYFELPTSPYPNTTQSVTDVAADITLNVASIAPLPGFNDPPSPGLKPTYFQGRIWMIVSSNQVIFSALEEATTGVPEESFVSGVAGNFWTFDQTVKSLEAAGTGLNQTLMVFCPGKIYGISGTTLDTFRRFPIAERRGTRSRTATTSLGGLVAWFDSAGQVWGADGSNVLELGVGIRTDTKTFDQSLVGITFHTSGEAHWLVVSAGPKGLFVLDLDTQRWMPPWTVQLNYLNSREVSAGNYALMGATSTRALVLNQSGTVGSFNDYGFTYQPIAKMSLKPVVPDYSNYSAAYSELANQPSRTGVPSVFQVDTNNNKLSDVSFCVDDDPTLAATSYTSIFKNVQTPQIAYNRTQGTNILQQIFTMNGPSCRWIGMQIKGQQADDNLRLYGTFIGAKPRGGEQ